MKVVLKDGKEFEASTVSFNYAAMTKGDTPTGSYSITVPVTTKPTELVNELVTAFTVPGNISKITVIAASDTDGEDVTEFEFTEVTNIHLSIEDKAKSATVTLQ